MHGILVATDGSKTGDRVVDVAADLARQMDCELLLVNIARLLPRSGSNAEDRHMDFIVGGKRGLSRLIGLLHGSVCQKLASTNVGVVP